MQSLKCRQWKEMTGIYNMDKLAAAKRTRVKGTGPRRDKLKPFVRLGYAPPYVIKELNKAIKKAGGEKLSKMDEMDWMEVFETKKAEAQNLKAEIDKTDAEIDAMVYELYNLTEEEIQIIENN